MGPTAKKFRVIWQKKEEKKEKGKGVSRGDRWLMFSTRGAYNEEIDKYTAEGTMWVWRC